MEDLEGVYYFMEDSNNFNLIRFCKNQKVILISISGKFKDIQYVCEWFDLDKHGNPKSPDSDYSVNQYHTEGKNISFEENVTIYLSHEDEGEKGIIEYNGEILNKESISLNSYNHINKHESHGVIYKKYNGVEDEIEEGIEEKDLDNQDFWEVTEQRVVIYKDDEIVAEGHAYEVFIQQWLEDYNDYQREMEGYETIIVDGKEFEVEDEHEIIWEEEEVLDGPFDSLVDAEKSFNSLMSSIKS